MIRKENRKMISLTLIIIIGIVLFRLTVLMFHVAGKVIGGILSISGWLILAGLAVTLFRLAMYVIPVILIVGVIALVVGIVF